MGVLISRRQMAAKTADRWREQYGPMFGVFPFGDAREVLKQLESLGRSPTVEQVEAICPGWTVLRCDECRDEVDEVVQLGEPPDYESSTAVVCLRCLVNACALFHEPRVIVNQH
jgi:hypothetical protein